MKLRDIPNYLTVKVCRPDWLDGEYIRFDGLVWVDEDGDEVDFKDGWKDSDAWEVYREPARVSRDLWFEVVRPPYGQPYVLQIGHPLIPERSSLHHVAWTKATVTWEEGKNNE